MQSSSLRRQMKNMVNNYTEAEIKVREATSNDPWGPSSTLMAEIADLTYNVVAFTEVMGMILKRLNDHGKNWRHVYKALTLLDYLVKAGSERVAKSCRDNIFTIQTLKDFQYIDRDGHDQGIHVREKAKKLVALLKDDGKLKSERSQAQKTKSRVGKGSAGYTVRHSGDDVNRCRSPSYNSSLAASPSSRLDPDLEQAIPASSGEEELQLQLALAMSREESEKPPPTVGIDEQTQLQIAMKLSKEEAQKPVKRAPPPAMEMDEDAQLQLALSLSKEEHQQEQRTRRGDDSDLQKALEESKREMEGKGGTAFMDLVDIFAAPKDAPPSDIHWNNTSHKAAAGARATDPWDSLDKTPRADSPWMVPPSQSPPPPWEPPAYPWDALQDNISKPNAQDWTSASSGVDPFLAPSDTAATKGAFMHPPLRSGSPSDGDLFDEAMDGGHASINGQDEDSSDLFNMSGLRDSLANTKPRTCRTPESFLGPTAASLVDLDVLIPTNPPPKTTNPFLAGLSAPSAVNPFQAEQPKVSLNEMSSSFASPVSQSTSLPYSASLPLPTSHQGAAIPSSLTHPTPPGLELPVKLPEPLLPFSSATNEESQASQTNINPFL
ncbi:epsin-3 isoform X4 [Poeciliopsis prolifica]|uniref:epsin-3 isoform X4 n=1 Tax=Poeciliopsis prolifica TaxID=188132 RepID=UPI0024132CCC|nr:epsin-3 isoform X4 [Poeciliopsis prolifica]